MMTQKSSDPDPKRAPGWAGALGYGLAGGLVAGAIYTLGMTLFLDTTQQVVTAGALYTVFMSVGFTLMARYLPKLRR